MSGPECCSNPPTLDPNSGTGNVEKIAGFDAYVTGSSDSKLAVLLVSDVYGYESPNFRKLADKVAAAGFYVVVPDFLNNDPYNPENTDRPLPVWIKDHEPLKGYEDAKLVVEALKSKGFSSIGVAGFCWGGKVGVELAKEKCVDAVVMLHPAFVSVDDFKGVKIPISVLGAEVDQATPPELVKQFEEVLKGKHEIDSFVKIFAGAAHGWTTRYDVKDEEACKLAEEAHADMIEWFNKYVK